jgi:sigma-54 dependent transcriptional regulator, acetoin dehydrogenase operon transcriptional activator AcoR
MSSTYGVEPRSNPARPEIELSWKRSRLSGVAPAAEHIADLPVVEFDPGSHLVAAASPVLGQMAEKLSGTEYSLLLGDRDCRLVYRWFDDPRFESVMDSLGLRGGASLAEDSVGTNALGTAIETRHGIAIHGDEHFIEPFKGFTCYGHPIRHPVTRRLEGVLDITGVSADANPLLAPFLVRAVEDIEHRLLDQAKVSERALLSAFQIASQQRRAVAAMGDDIVLTNKSALDLLSPADYALMRMLMDDLDRAAEHTADVRLASGAVVRAHLARIAGAGGGTIFHLVPITEREVRPSGRRTPKRAEPAVLSGPVLVTGAPGTGRSTEARRLAREDEVEFRNCSDVVVDGPKEFGRALRDRLGRREGTVCLENIDQLPDAFVTVVADSLGRGGGPRLILTSLPVDQLNDAQQALASLCLNRIDLLPLGKRGAELAEIANRLVKELNPSADIRLIPSVLEVLSSRPWPGNLHELKAVLAHVVQHRRTGDVVVADLPEDYRVASGDRRLSGRERAEREAIVDTLRRLEGNKLRAAEDLGISRTTLYARMRALKITGF